MSAVRCVWNGRARLGEGPVWDQFASVLWFVDIKGRLVHCLNPASETVADWKSPSPVGWVLPIGDGTLLAGLSTGLALFNPATGRFSHVLDVEAHLQENRLNDAVAGPDGCVWFGSMDERESSPSGRYYRWDGYVARDVGIEGTIVTNGPAMSPDGTILYHVDTIAGVIHASDVTLAGEVTHTRPLVRIKPADGNPDGVSVDAAGNIWVGLWGGWKARLYSPTGGIITEIRLPAANVTKVALGGADLRTAYATTAAVGTNPIDQPGAGALYSFRVATPGLPTTPARFGATVGSRYFNP